MRTPAGFSFNDPTHATWLCLAEIVGPGVCGFNVLKGEGNNHVTGRAKATDHTQSSQQPFKHNLEVWALAASEVAFGGWVFRRIKIPQNESKSWNSCCVRHVCLPRNRWWMSRATPAIRRRVEYKRHVPGVLHVWLVCGAKHAPTSRRRFRDRIKEHPREGREIESEEPPSVASLRSVSRESLALPMLGLAKPQDR